MRSTYTLLVSFLNYIKSPNSPFQSAYLTNSKWGGRGVILVFKYDSINKYEAEKLKLHVFLTEAADGDGRSPFRSCLIRPGRKNHPCTLDYKKGGRKASLDMMEKKEIRRPVKKPLR